VEVPSDATPETDWQVCRLTRQRYYDPTKPERASWDIPGTIGYREAARLADEPNDTDAYVLRKKRLVAVTPLGLDLTAQVDMVALDRLMRK
jgi:broad specificity polyphosphatase/5'/3'-nucleotidase SurE